MRKPNWDTEAGREMFLAGRKDAEIADAFGISVYAVTNYRVKHWQKPQEEQKSTERKSSFSLQKPVTAGEGVAPAILNKIRGNAEKAGIHLPGADTTASPLAGMKAFDFERGLKPPFGEPEAVPEAVPEQEIALSAVPPHNDSVAEDLTAEEKGTEEAPAPMEDVQAEMPSRDTLDALTDAVKVLQGLAKGQGISAATETVTPHQTPAVPASPRGEAFVLPKPRLDELDVMAAATEHLSGMKAVCTACAIQALWFWSGPADLRRAKKNIDWLLDHVEG